LSLPPPPPPPRFINQFGRCVVNPAIFHREREIEKRVKDGAVRRGFGKRKKEREKRAKGEQFARPISGHTHL
jgi:hypothetical protein